ncbi:HET-domain-containing protein [Pseudovirgaria hyperparasitica]|uniref:HET-domain-containing protein n=1 Tax=Pseudovirgaria hyperparasitica TaxID=470096 RepID=A0A6A6W678_9PEZI|nr:HET-domain-containing protein [Pseudovirgaria hyperparasitica]KAF2758428.1 HET-domain-containing protein [Pseudovirgaria hyperparasitica]
MAQPQCDDHGQIPAYAILSHTWLADNDQEVTFEDIVKQAYQGKDGYQKIDFSFKQAARHGLRYCWIDTCCIDKSSSQELSEALNSMFRWYRNAARCYVYLSDVCKDDSDHANVVSETWWREPFKKSRWFSRGWTLQELLAPTTLEFYSKEGSLLGTKSSLEREVNARTGIQLSALRGTTPLNQFSVTERRSWAEHRETKRPEDSAYCLMGIFDVSMYPLYSEGRDRAFLRLEEEIDKASQREKEPGSRKHTNDDDHEVPVRKRLKVETHLRLDHDQVAKIMESLKYDQIEARQLNIKAPHSKTCKWIVDKTEFVSWQDFTKPCGILWIKGKPGSGKSTLMKYLLVYARRHIKVAALLSFFFNARGSDLEKSTNGAYRTLLVQLLDKIPTLQSIFDSLGPLAGSIETSHHWTTEVLKNLLIEAVQSLQGSTIVCLVDALDECDVDDVRDMVSFFEELCEYARSANGELRICFASRHYPHITIDTAINLIFEGQEGHQEDIERYLKSKLRIHDADVAEKARALLLERASGIFMWIVLVVDMLNKDYDRGREAEIEQRISNTPKDLHGLFHDMLTRDEHGKGYLLLCLQWVLFSKRPLKLAELYFAIQSTTSQFNASLRKASDTTMERFILDVSKGLVELTKTKSPVVQFIHESVRDYLLKTQALKLHRMVHSECEHALHLCRSIPDVHRRAIWASLVRRHGE